MSIVQIKRKLGKLLGKKVTGVELVAVGRVEDEAVCERCSARIKRGARYLLVEHDDGDDFTVMCVDVVACEARIVQNKENDRRRRIQMDRDVERSVRFPKGL